MEDMTNLLQELNVKFSMKDKKNDIGTLEVRPQDLTLSVYSAKRGGDAYYRIYSQWNAPSEWRPATDDIVSLEWDPEYGEYWSSNVGDTSKVYKRDGSQRLKGAYLFGVDDEFFDFDSYVVVYVVPKKSGWLNYGSKYSHTYATDDVTYSGGAYFEWSTTGPTGGISYNVTTREKESSWPKWEDNAVLF